MKIRDRILSLLNEKPLATREIQKAIPDKSGECLAATISNNPLIFLRLNKGYVGLCNRDEHLATDWKSKGLPLYKKMVNCLQNGEKRLEQLYNMLPYDKKVSIRASVNIYPHLFIRVGRGVIGRKDRDEVFIERYKKLKKENIIEERGITIAELIATILADGPKTLEQIHRHLPDTPRKSISCKLSLDKRFSVSRGVWRVVNVTSVL